jgi:hypothetical protein
VTHSPEPRPTVLTGSRGGGERRQVLLLALLLVGGLAAYVGLTALNRDGRAQQDLLPYQFLASSLPESEQQVFRAIREAIAPMETARFEMKRWLDPASLSARGAAIFTPPAEGGTARAWQKFDQGTTVNYLGLPPDQAGAAWLLTITEPEPGSVPDNAPNDDEHHRLPDGTVLHIYVWTHRFGSEIKPAFIRQPETQGWIQIFRTPPNPAAAVPPRS